MPPPSSNWSALKKNLVSPKHVVNRPAKRRRVDSLPENPVTTEGPVLAAANETKHSKPPANRDSVDYLRRMVRGQVEYHAAHLLPGRYIALDCEMVGIAGDSKSPMLSRQRDESSLARVSVVNYHGAVQLDVFVKQRERVTDWRTAFSGVRESDMINAKPFSEVQKLVSDLLKDKILVGHAVHNDLKVLLLAHPYHLTRDTQTLAGIHGTLSTSGKFAGVVSNDTTRVKFKGNKRLALRKIVEQELGIEIQAGEHSSVTDARATMAIYRLHRKIWDQGFLAAVSAYERKRLNSMSGAGASSPDEITGVPSKNGKRSQDDLTGSDEDTDKGPEPSQVISERPSKKIASHQNKKGISSGLSVVVKTRRAGKETRNLVAGTRGGGSAGKTANWWGTLG